MTEGPDGDDEAKPPRTTSSAPPRPSSAPPRPSQAPPRPSQAPRPSQPPSAPDPLDGIGRLVFAGIWLVVQGALILNAGRSPDGAFGFRMFPESSTIKVALYREVRRTDGERMRVHVDDGMWAAKDAFGMQRSFAWRDRVRRRELMIFDNEISAAYGVKAQLDRLQGALDDVTRHIPDDAETERLSLEVTVRYNGREPYVTTLVGPQRLRDEKGSR